MTKEPGISPIQEKALRALLKIKGVNYAKLVKDAFTSKNIPVPKHTPALSVLTYREAIMIVKYGNKKFRDKKPSNPHI